MQIRAAVLRDPKAPYQLEELTLADPGPGEIVVRITGVGHCHSDLVPRSSGAFSTPPIVVGHEGSGVVEAIGAQVDSVRCGDHVVLSYDACGRCSNCRTGRPAGCQTFVQRNFGSSRPDKRVVATDAQGQPVAARWFGQSSFATHALVAERNVTKVDKDLPLELLGPLGCGIQTGAGAVLLALRVPTGASIAVLGVGAVGLSAVMAAHLCGASTIVAVDVHPRRLAMARELGATHTLLGAEPDLGAQLRATTNGGIEFVLDTTGSPALIEVAINSLTTTGICGLAGLQRGDLVLPPSALATGRSVLGIVEGDAVPQTFIPKLIRLWQHGRFPFDKLITTYPLDQINEAEKASTRGEVIKPVLLPAT